MSLKKVIGTVSFSYPEKRNFAGHVFKEYTFRKVIDLYKFPSWILFKLRNKINRKWQNTFLDIGLNRCHFFHFFNVISEGKQPYITTYETTLPRWRDTDDDFKHGLLLLAKDNCKNLIAISECAFRKQEEIIAKYSPGSMENIMKKNIVLLPPQVPFIRHISEKRVCSGSIVFTIVGADFFRKGGLAILRTFDRLLDEGCPVMLNIVSSLNYGDYASKTTRKDYQNAHQIIQKHEKNIRLFKALENAEVIKLLLDSDVALLPSLAETFGYFILEAQAAGCPVISTDIRAMPEINNELKGWLIQIKEENKYDADISDPETIYRKIEVQLTAIIRSIIENPSLIRLKGDLAIQGIISNHSPEQHKQKLQELYDKI